MTDLCPSSKEKKGPAVVCRSFSQPVPEKHSAKCWDAYAAKHFAGKGVFVGTRRN